MKYKGCTANAKTGVINDPLSQPTVAAGSDFLIETDGLTTCVKIVITTGRDCGRPRGSIYGNFFKNFERRTFGT